MDTSIAEAIGLGFMIGTVLGVILCLILEYFCHIDALLRSPHRRRRSHNDEYGGNVAVQERASHALPPSQVRTPRSTDEENPSSSRSQSSCVVVAQVHRVDESSGASSAKEGGAASSSPHSKQVLSSPERKQVSSSPERRKALSSSRERSRAPSSRERSRVSSSQKRPHGSSSRKQQSKSCSPDKMFERSPEPSVRIRRSAGIAARSSSQPQPSSFKMLTEEETYRKFVRSQEVQALSLSASRSSHTSSVTRPSQVCTVSPSTALSSSPSSQPRPIIRAPEQLREPQTPPPTAPSRTTKPKGLPQVPSSSESSRRGVSERMSRISAFAASSRSLWRSLQEQLPSPLSGGLRTKPPLSKDEPPIPLSKLHGGDSDEKSEDDEDAL